MNESVRPKLIMIVAASENDLIGKQGELPWSLSADLRRFKRLTMGHTIIMGRKTFESIGRLLPGRNTVIITRNPDYQFEGAHVVASLESALAIPTQKDSVFLIGGAEIYRLALPQVDEIQLTRVHVQLEGDTYLPTISWDDWELLSDENHPADDKNAYPYSFLHYRRK